MSTTSNPRVSTPNISNRNNGRQTAPTAPAPVMPEPDTDGGLVEIDADEGFDIIKPSTPKQPARLKGNHPATIVNILKKDEGTPDKKMIRLVFIIELDQRRPDGSAFEGRYNCVKCWKPGSEYQKLAAKALGRSFTSDELATGVKPFDLIGKPIIVDVREHRPNTEDGSTALSTLKIHDIKALDSTTEGSAETQQ